MYQLPGTPPPLDLELYSRVSQVLSERRAAHAPVSEARGGPEVARGGEVDIIISWMLST